MFKRLLPNDVRENLIQDGLARCALLADALLYHQVSREWLTVKEICGLLPFTSETLIREGLGENTVFDARPRKTGKRGRPQYEYRLVGPARLAPFYATHTLHAGFGQRIIPFIDSDLIDDRAFESVKSYRLMLQREYLIRNSRKSGWHQESQTSMAQRLGISERTLRRYHAELEPEVEAVIEIEALQDLDALPDQPYERRSQWLEVGTYGDVTARYERATRKMPYCKDAAAWARDQGYTVWVATRRPNRYRLSA